MSDLLETIARAIAKGVDAVDDLDSMPAEYQSEIREGAQHVLWALAREGFSKRDLDNLERAYDNERAHCERLTHHVGVQWGIRFPPGGTYPEGHVMACGDKGGACYGVTDHAGFYGDDEKGTLIRREVSEWVEVTDDPDLEEWRNLPMNGADND